MKTLLFFLIVCPVLLLAQWQPVPSGTSKSLHDVHFPTSNVGYIVGDSGIVLKSLNGGMSWQQVYANDTLTFVSVFFTSTLTGYAAGNQLFKTTDGGNSWNLVLGDTNEMREVYFVNASLGFAGAHNAVYRTTDSGNTWSICITSGTGYFTAIYFPSPLVGYFIGGSDFANALFKTTNGGQTFTQIANSFQSIKEEAHFLNDTVGYMCGWYGGLVAKTSNGGMSWKVLDTINWPQCWDIYFDSEPSGYYLSGKYIRRTVDGGANWSTEFTAAQGLNEFFFLGPGDGIAVGVKGGIYRKKENLVGIIPGPMKSDLIFYPNPSDGNIMIRNADPACTYKLFDITGALVKFGALQDDVINVSDVAKGCYVIQLKTLQPVTTRRVIIE
jgi:photosystem II stability/assembly factor-like uncharacterized protein